MDSGVASKPPVISIVGRTGSGKTALLERVLPLLRARGLRVAVVKHGHHGPDAEAPGKDTQRLLAAGAAAVRFVAGEEVPGLPALPAVDLILTEGYKGGPYPKVLVLGGSGPPLPPLEGVVAVVGEGAAASPAPRFAWGDVEGVAGFLAQQRAG